MYIRNVSNNFILSLKEIASIDRDYEIPRSFSNRKYFHFRVGLRDIIVSLAKLVVSFRFH